MIVCILYWVFHIIFVVITMDVHTSSLKPHKVFRCKNRGKRKGWQAEHALVAQLQARSVIGSTPGAYQPFLFLLHNVWIPLLPAWGKMLSAQVIQLLSHVRLSVAQYYNWSDYYDSHLTCMLVLSFPSSLTQHMFMPHVWVMNWLKSWGDLSEQWLLQFDALWFSSQWVKACRSLALSWTTGTTLPGHSQPSLTTVATKCSSPPTHTHMCMLVLF